MPKNNNKNVNANEDNKPVVTPVVNPEDVKPEDTPTTKKLEVKVPFTDKYDETKHYKIGDVIEVVEERAAELLADLRNLVSEKK